MILFSTQGAGSLTETLWQPKELSWTSHCGSLSPATATAVPRRPGTRSGRGPGRVSSGTSAGSSLSRTAVPGGGFDLGLGRAADDPLPAETRAVEPVGDLDPAEVAAAVVDLGEGGGAPARGGQVGAGGDGAALAAAAAEVDRDQRQAAGAGLARAGAGARARTRRASGQP